MTRPGVIAWLTGRPAAGKSTIAAAAAAQLRRRGREVAWLDSDTIRRERMPELGYDDGDRDMFYARLGELALEAAERNDVVLVSATAPYARYRNSVRVRARRFVEVLVTAPEATLTARDPKGLYAAARDGAVTRLPGIDHPYEAPARPELVCDTATASVDALVAALVAHLEN